MSKRVVEFFIIDILIALDKVRRYSADVTNAQDFYYDEKSFDATMRELQIIGEATKHLINSELFDNSYRVIVDFRNLIVHEYFGIDADEIWDIVTNELIVFEKDVLEVVKDYQDKALLLKVIGHAKDDLRYKGRTVEFLRHLETVVR